MSGTRPRALGNFYSRFLNPNAPPPTLTSNHSMNMLHFTPPPLGGIMGLGGAEIGIVFALCGMIFGGIMGLAGMYFHHQRKRLWHETARIALEKGQPVPPHDAGESEENRDPTNRWRANHDVRGGLVLLAVGAGLWLLLLDMPGRIHFVGAIPGFIGIALLLYALLATIFGRKNEPPRS